MVHQQSLFGVWCSCLDALKHPFLCGPRWRVAPSMDIIRWGLGSTAVRISEEYIYRMPQVYVYKMFLKFEPLLTLKDHIGITKSLCSAKDLPTSLN